MTNPLPINLELPDESRPEQILIRVDQALNALSGDDAYKERMQTIVPGVGEVLGVRVPQLRAIAAQVKSTYRSQPKLLLDLARACWGRGSREHRMIALFLLAGMKKLSPHDRWSMAEEFLPDVRDWETCDQLCAALSGQALAEDPVYMDRVEALAKDKNFWIRRVAIVSTVLLRRAKFDETLARSLDQRTLKICKNLLDDEEKYIRKAVDWALRELIKRSYDLGLSFMMEQAVLKPGYPARATLKLAAKKLTAEDQEHFLAVLGS